MEMVIIPTAELQTMIKIAVKEAMDNAAPILEIAKSEPDNELLTRKQVRKLFNVSLPTLARWGKLNVLPCLRINRSIRYRASDVQKALQQKNGGET
ncbi:MAG: helix-turn-helix domain-containing protein [Ignavibacteria bacterium]|nr:helix-turn-helix domain-containing protein [Ignavibacteria bacterium]